MSEQAYRIKPLAWVEDRFPCGKHIDTRRRLRCESAVGKLTLTLAHHYGGDRWEFHHMGHFPKTLPAGTDEAGARAFVAGYYLTLLLPALEPADDLTQSEGKS